MSEISPEILLFDLEDTLRSMPSFDDFYDQKEVIYPWFGRFLSLAEKSEGRIKIIDITQSVDDLSSSKPLDFDGSLRKIKIRLHKIIYDLRMNTVGPLSISIDTGSVYRYFEEMRKIIESAKSDLYFIDPYLDAEFVSNYFPHITEGITVRLLTRENIKKLTTTADAFKNEHKTQIEIRKAENFHDRYIFVDKLTCYQSGSSFKDGAKKTPTTLTQITDAFPAMLDTYESMWDSGEKFL